VKALSRRGLARVQLGDYSLAQSDILNALDLLHENDVAERERIKIILMKAKKGLSDQNKALEKRKESMQRAFAAKDGGIGDSRVKPEPRQKKVKQSSSFSLLPARSQAPLVIFIFLFIAVVYFYILRG
jgi:hypothetical protein